MKVFLIDIDNTLYSKTSGIFDIIDKRINDYMKDIVHIEENRINSLRIRYWKQYGTSLLGLMKHYGVDPNHFLDFVHDLDIKPLIKENKNILKILKKIDAVKIAFTNAPKEHAVKVLDSLNITNQFVDIFDIRSADFLGKPNKRPYIKIINKTNAKRYAMIDDSYINLKTAQELGAFTILIGDKKYENINLSIEKFEDLDPEIINNL